MSNTDPTAKELWEDYLFNLKATLVDHCEDLARELRRWAKRLKDDPTAHMPSFIIQVKGTTIDGLCARIATLQEVLESLGEEAKP